MERKYLMIDSTYRDRLLYPNPAEFIVPINIPTGSNIFNSKNPIVSGYPITNFSFLSDTGMFQGLVVGGNPNAIQVDSSIDILTGINNPDVYTTLDMAMDMFINLLFRIDGDDNYYRITGYDSVRHIIYVDSSVIGFSIGSTYSIVNNSSSNSIVLQGYKLSVNGFPGNEDGFFLSSSRPVYVWDLTLNEIRTGELSNFTITLDQPFSPTWNVSDKYLISITNTPLEYGTFISVIPGVPCLRSGILRLSILDQGSQYINHDIVNIIAQYDSRPDYAIGKAKILFTNNGSITKIELLYCGCDYIMNGIYYLLPEGESFRPNLATVQILSTATGFLVDNTLNTMCGTFFMPTLLTPEFHYNSFTDTIEISPNGSIPFIPNRITPLTMIETNTLNGLTPIIDVLYYNNQKIIMTQLLDNELYKRLYASNLNFFPESFTYHILPFRSDGCVSMDYRGTTVSMNQMVCYAMTVNTLILPNQILNLPFGSLTSSYPYVLLEITNETSSSGHNKSVIYSNNPNTVSATFVCSISDVNSPVITKFININSDRATQIIKFKPNDNLRFRISMPDGRTFETELKDYTPPLPPNPLLQINCLLEIIRL